MHITSPLPAWRRHCCGLIFALTLVGCNNDRPTPPAAVKPSSAISHEDAAKLLDGVAAQLDALKDALGGDVITFVGRDLPLLQSVIQQKLGIAPQLIEDRLRIERPQAHLFVPQLIEAAPGLIDSISVGRPTLDDVFVHRTGRRLHTAALPT